MPLERTSQGIDSGLWDIADMGRFGNTELFERTTSLHLASLGKSLDRRQNLHRGNDRVRCCSLKDLEEPNMAAHNGRAEVFAIFANRRDPTKELCKVRVVEDGSGFHKLNVAILSVEIADPLSQTLLREAAIHNRFGCSFAIFGLRYWTSNDQQIRASVERGLWGRDPNLIVMSHALGTNARSYGD